MIIKNERLTINKYPKYSPSEDAYVMVVAFNVHFLIDDDEYDFALLFKPEEPIGECFDVWAEKYENAKVKLLEKLK